MNIEPRRHPPERSAGGMPRRGGCEAAGVRQEGLTDKVPSANPSHSIAALRISLRQVKRKMDLLLVRSFGSLSPLIRIETSLRALRIALRA